MGCELFKLGNTTGFICGAKPDHECDSDGPVLAFNNCFEYYDVSERPDWEQDCDGYIKWMEKRDITGGCVSCSICGKPFTPPTF